MCRLSLAWVTSENSTMLLGSDILRLFFTGPYLVSSPLCSVSGVDCPSVDPRQLPLLLSNYQLLLLLSSYQLPLSGPCLSLGRVVNSHSPPRTTSGYGEISCPRILCLVSRQNRQLNRLLWQPTHIVLQLIGSPEVAGCSFCLSILLQTLIFKEAKTEINSAFPTHQREMMNIWQIFHSRTNLYT